ncbi:hypothetical protein BLNAU_16846 [Blattamonas nauphoetae]|uniref:Uncharacterized protein n=1 Tax=Blattamonas nauphoetae TaxID=2049346 RepID=A0ABQ9XAD8_9EUKA|nr:hypothetical protein BLNAU_16846 [Blattamonas nauphoetae]
MFALTIISAVAGLKVGKYIFPVENLRLNGSAYAIPVQNETLYFNLFGTVNSTEHCGASELGDNLTAYTASSLEDLDLCFPVAMNGTEEVHLIQKNPRANPTGLHIMYNGTAGSDSALSITLNCHRLSTMNVTRGFDFVYNLTINHPAGCPKQPRQKMMTTRDQWYF